MISLYTVGFSGVVMKTTDVIERIRSAYSPDLPPQQQWLFNCWLLNSTYNCAVEVRWGHMPLASSDHDIIVHLKGGQATRLGFGWHSSNIDTFASGTRFKVYRQGKWVFVFLLLLFVAIIKCRIGDKVTTMVKCDYFLKTRQLKRVDLSELFRHHRRWRKTWANISDSHR